MYIYPSKRTNLRETSIVIANIANISRDGFGLLLIDLVVGLLLVSHVLSHCLTRFSCSFDAEVHRPAKRFEV
jgi:hypothetical protein